MSSSYYTPIGGLGITHLGNLADNGSTSMTGSSAGNRPVMYVWLGVASLSSGASAYHGYKRSRGSVGSAVGWGLLGFFFPIITPAVALAQGFGKPKVSSNRRRRTSRRRR
jgi:hypothetical protein